MKLGYYLIHTLDPSNPQFPWLEWRLLNHPLSTSLPRNRQLWPQIWRWEECWCFWYHDVQYFHRTLYAGTPSLHQQFSKISYSVTEVGHRVTKTMTYAFSVILSLLVCYVCNFLTFLRAWIKNTWESISFHNSRQQCTMLQNNMISNVPCAASSAIFRRVVQSRLPAVYFEFPAGIGIQAMFLVTALYVRNHYQHLETSHMSPWKTFHCLQQNRRCSLHQFYVETSCDWPDQH